MRLAPIFPLQAGIHRYRDYINVTEIFGDSVNKDDKYDIIGFCLIAWSPEYTLEVF